MTRYADDVATGTGGRQKLQIRGRPSPGQREKLVIAEEPGEAVLMHWNGHLVPHFKRDCPNCEGHKSEPKPLWYVGASTLKGEQVILELTQKCLETVRFYACSIPAKLSEPQLFDGDWEFIKQGEVFTGLLVEIIRGSSPRSQRVLRCEHRVEIKNKWPYRTREELARIWGVPIRPRIYKQDEA
jgi:hypothetical protein